jgi:hypothetical protein
MLKRQTSRSHYGSKVPAVTITVFKYRNKIGKIVVKAVSIFFVETMQSQEFLFCFNILSNKFPSET